MAMPFAGELLPGVRVQSLQRCHDAKSLMSPLLRLSRRLWSNTQANPNNSGRSKSR
jgi:hypothetical protein